MSPSRSSEPASMGTLAILGSTLNAALITGGLVRFATWVSMNWLKSTAAPAFWFVYTMKLVLSTRTCDTAR